MAKIPINIKDGTVKKEDIIVGIDLGTTNSLIAYIKDGKPFAIASDTTRTIVPSIVHFDEEGSILVGDKAKERLLSHPERTIYSVKRLMGKSYNDFKGEVNMMGYNIVNNDEDALVKIQVGQKFYTPIELSAQILRELKSRAEKDLNVTLTKAVITVPAYFNDAQRQATRDAGKLAGLDVLRIVNEPTAASLAYGLDQGDKEETIAVYDLGGGTFDISILQLQNGIFEVLSTNGDTYLGGDDFDKMIMDRWIDMYNINNALDIKQELRLKAEEAKKHLSTASSYNGQLSNGISISLSKEDFETLVQPLVQKTIDRCTQALQDASLMVSQIHKVVMVGGSTRMPIVKESVSAYFEQKVYDDLDPDEVVSLGAAVQADILAGNRGDLLLLDITPLSLGIETVGGLMDTLLPRNSKIPASVGRQYTTSVDAQVNLKVSVYQGERELVQDNRKLGEFVLSGIPPMAAGLPKIEIQFIIDADGILKVRAKELRSGVETEVSIQSTYGISEEEMAKMLLDSIQHAETDLKARSLQESINEGKAIAQAGHKFIEQNKEWMDSTSISKTKELIFNLESSIGGSDKDKIQNTIQTLNQYTRPFAEQSIEQAIKKSLKGKEI